MQKSISILGSGWLGLPLAEQLRPDFDSVNISTRRNDKVALLLSARLQPFIIDIDNITDNIQPFLQSNTLIINITSKNVEGFKNLIKEIEMSPVKEILLVSSTSVYPSENRLCQESEPLDMSSHPLLIIEELFNQNKHFKTTIVRFSGLIGGKRHPGRFFASGKAIQFADAGVNMIHITDCLAIIGIIIKRHIFPELLNACADTHPSKAQFYTLNALALGFNKPNLSDKNTPSNKIVSNEKLKKCLNYQFIYGDLMQLDPIRDYDLTV
ncbi:dTDP-glucose 4,6-dehydratase [Psychromonas ingrahamii 37]|uniref:dTDP-glucose 4,6-dehydratase n=1 Tax=Psychromonas ingrahamii (strain DSM 17664 / CCUG 51855 / 37) TaxID=357804 RepID=A1T0P4_PSYIN|nr:dTDP-glucose 4,6-dehydratase [Psychromonas ingrahamii]ABM05309.1 dTDP-glucose 4,6-dehydratase [Psychromonas ingrahamii 37]